MNSAPSLPPPYNDQLAIWPMVGDFPVYDDFLYELMTNDVVRNAAYHQALDENCAGKVVLDVGTGADLVWARAAAKAGAEHVFAIEGMEASFHKASAKLRNLGLEKQITLIHGQGEAVPALKRGGTGDPEMVDVIVSEIIGEIASSEGSIPVLKQARDRFLKPNGLMIPIAARTHIAAASLPHELHNEPQFGFRGQSYADRIFQHTKRQFDIRISIENFPASNLLSTPALFEEIDYAGDLEIDSTLTQTLGIQQSGRIDGFVLWPEIICCEGVRIDGLQQQTNWFPAFFPVFLPRSLCRSR